MARTVPNTDQCRAAWKIHLAASKTKWGRQEQEMQTTTTRARKPKPAPRLVVATYTMDARTFALHFTKGHEDSLAGQEYLPENISFEVEQQYRSFHYRLHQTLVSLAHVHEQDPPEAGIDRAISALIENHNYGWKELAGISGLVAVFPDRNDIATRVDGKVIHHKYIEDAVEALANTAI